MRDIVAMVLAGGRVEELSVLTLKRPKAAVPFGGLYRMIDFALSALAQADIGKIGVLSLYRPSSLIDHVGTGEPWDLVGRGRAVKILPAYMASATSWWYRGTADAVYQNLHYIRKHQPKDVIILSGDHIHAVDFGPMIQQHRETNADLTMVVKPVALEYGRGRFGFAELDDRFRVIGYEEKPDNPRSNMASLTIYLFKTEALISRIEENARVGTTYQIYAEVLPQMVRCDRVFAYPYDGYWNYGRSVDAYHEANMDLLGDEPKIRPDRWGVRTRLQLRGLGDLPPARFLPGSTCVDSVISPGVVVAGTVIRSVLSPGVWVERGAVVQESVVLHDVRIRSGAEIDRAVLDKGVLVGEGVKLGVGDTACVNEEGKSALTTGISIVGKEAVIPPGMQIGRNCIVYPEVRAEDWKTKILQSGACLHAGGEGAA
jgi:glucose-1-phosphate adenylyltransferase